MKILIVDDERSISLAIEIAKSRSNKFTNDKNEYDIDIVRDYDSSVDMISKNIYEYVLLDHDLADKDDVYKDGSKLLNYIEERSFYGFDTVKDIIPISSNPVGIKRINMVREKLFGFNN